MSETAEMQPTNKLVFVTGPSGAGRSTAINVLEDIGFEAIDNIPLRLVPGLLDADEMGHQMALGLDTRNRDFSVNALLALVHSLSDRPELNAELLYLDCRPEILQRRYSETRRRHPLAPDNSPESGIAREIELLLPVRAQATVLIDTSDLTPHELRAELQRWFQPDPSKKLSIVVQSFSYKRGVPRGVDMVFDCRFLRNPHWEPDLRAQSGLDQAVQDYVAQDMLWKPFFDNLVGMSDLLLPAYREEGKTHLTIGFGCTGGQHRSVTLAEKLAKTLANNGWQVSIRHRELERRGASAYKPLASG